MMCNYIHSNLHSFVANDPCNYSIKLWFTLEVALMKLLWKFLMLVLGMNYLDWIVKKEKSTGTWGLYFSCFGPFFVRVWLSLSKPWKKEKSKEINFSLIYCQRKAKGNWDQNKKSKDFIIPGRNLKAKISTLEKF